MNDKNIHLFPQVAGALAIVRHWKTYLKPYPVLSGLIQPMTQCSAHPNINSEKLFF